MARIQLSDIDLSYTVYHDTSQSMQSTVKSLATGGLIQHARRGRVEVQALQDIALDIRDGERVALLGHNGAGKTTLLKVLAGIYKPQRGRIVREGRTVAVINPAIGLNPGETGRENIETIGLLSGLTRAEIKERIPEIEDFTQLGDFLGLPVSSYSSGMRTRLVFGVATSLHPDILILDENIGTGDAQFMNRAKARMEAMMDRSSILVLASHNVETLKRLCDRGVVMEQGRIVADCGVEEAARVYSSPPARDSKQSATKPLQVAHDG